MRRIFLSLLFFMLPPQSHAGHKVGNGGVAAWVCRGNSRIYDRKTGDVAFRDFVLHIKKATVLLSVVPVDKEAPENFMGFVDETVGGTPLGTFMIYSRKPYSPLQGFTCLHDLHFSGKPTAKGDLHYWIARYHLEIMAQDMDCSQIDDAAIESVTSR